MSTISQLSAADSLADDDQIPIWSSENSATRKVTVATLKAELQAAPVEVTGAVVSVAGKEGIVLLDKVDVGLSNVDNTADAGKPVSTAQQTALDAKADLVAGKVPSAQLPSYVDDVLEYANAAALPATGETGKIYVTLDDNAQRRWSGSAYVVLVASPGSTDAVTEGATNKYFTEARVRATALTGLSTASATAITSADSVLTALGKAQAQITAIPAAGGSIALAATAWVEVSGNDSTGALGNPAKPYATINAALDALPSTGGRINIGVGTFAPVMDDLNGSVLDASSKLKANVWFCGSGMPKFKSDNTALEGGTIIQGPLLAHSTRHGLKFTDLGIDSGSTVCAALYGSTPQDTLDFANVGQIVGLAQCEGIVVHNVRTICYSAAGASHTMLFENLKNPDVRNVSGRFGSLGIVIKSDGGTFDGIESSGHSTASLYIKEGNTGSNSAPCKEVNISNVSLSAVTASDTPTGVLMVAAAGQPLKGIQIDNLLMRGITGQEFTISAESGTVSDIRINNFRTDAGVARVGYVNTNSVDKASIYINGQPLDGVVTLTDGATINTDCSKGSGVYKVTLASTGRTLANPTNMISGQTYVWQIIQDGTGSRTITTYGSAFSFSGGTPTQSTAAGAVDLLTAVYDGSKLRSVYTKAFA